MANFIDYMIESSKVEENELGYELQEKIKSAADARDLQDFFKNKGYDVPLSDCEKLIQNKDKLSDIKGTVNRDAY